MTDAGERTAPRVVSIRVRGRFVPFAAILVLFALLPFLGGTGPAAPVASVVLAAGSSTAVQEAVDAVDRARAELSTLDVTAVTDVTDAAATAPAGSAFTAGIGGGLFMFPSISLAPATAEAIAAPIIGRPLFIHPVPGGETSPFGPRIHPLLGRPMFHTGIDLAAACGTPIRAAADGVVVYARVSASWGGRTIIQHSPTLKTAYGHQSAFLVTEGQVVKQGQVIGLSGTTGWSTGCHLHFDVIVDDRYVDPAPYLGFPPSDAASVPYAAVPHLVFDPASRLVDTVADGDVPITDASVIPSGPTSTGGRPPTTTPTTSGPTTPSGTPTTATPSTTTSTPGPTTSTPTPTSTAPSPTTTTVPPTTTSVPPTTTSVPPTTTDPPTTSVPPTTTTPPSTTTDPSTGTTTTTTTTTDAPTTPSAAPSSPSSSSSAGSGTTSLTAS
ncbi:M23 family metallopeptidase [Terrabacter sp. 2YAF2]|uniref:M23 family metallopeptidase n=1 Tax=Terrabacter sp. 2YAF2 TaxID=3233026 RepID=UPI003F96E031